MKVGDRVKVVQVVYDEISPWFKVGNVGTIEEMEGDGTVRVVFDEDGFGNRDFWWTLPEELEVISNDEAAD